MYAQHFMYMLKSGALDGHSYFGRLNGSAVRSMLVIKNVVHELLLCRLTRFLEKFQMLFMTFLMSKMAFPLSVPPL